MLVSPSAIIIIVLIVIDNINWQLLCTRIELSA
jgi:hypothetical protein